MNITWDPQKAATFEDYETVTLFLEHYGAKFVADSDILSDAFKFPAYIRAVFDPILEKMMLSIRQGIYTQQYPAVKVTYPATWLDWVKNRFFPKWLLLFFPVKWKTETIMMKELYPLIGLPEERPIIRLYKREW